MNKKKEKGSNFLQTLSNKINNIQTEYDIDEEYPDNNNSNFINKNTSNLYDIQGTTENNNDILKESIVFQDNNQQSPSPQDLSPINSVFCKYHKKEFLKLNQNNFEIVCRKCLEEGNKSQLEIETNTTSENFEKINNDNSEFN